MRIFESADRKRNAVKRRVNNIIKEIEFYNRKFPLGICVKEDLLVTQSTFDSFSEIHLAPGIQILAAPNKFPKLNHKRILSRFEFSLDQVQVIEKHTINFLYLGFIEMINSKYSQADGFVYYAEQPTAATPRQAGEEYILELEGLRFEIRLTAVVITDQVLHYGHKPKRLEVE